MIPLVPEGLGRARWARRAGVMPSAASPLFRAAEEAELGEGAALRAIEIAQWTHGLDAAERSAFAWLVLALLHAEAQGSTRLIVAGPGATLGRHLDALGAADRSDACQSLWSRMSAPEVPAGGESRSALGHPVVGVPGQFAPLIVEGDALVGYRYREAEKRIRDEVARRTAEVSADETFDRALDRAVADVVAEAPLRNGRPIRLSDEQLSAVRAAAGARLSLISGGPGTGKTSVVVSVLRVLLRLPGGPRSSVSRGPLLPAEVALAAPTGKAADRMRSSIAGALRALATPGLEDRALLREPPPSQTLHRLLGYSPRSGRFRHDADNPLGARLVVVDEASMIDAQMMDRLLAALAPDASLVLLGDADQLPSVDPGAVFRDLVAGGAGVSPLTRSYRMDPRDPAGRHILTVAQRIAAGDPGAIDEPKTSTDPSSFVGRRGAGELMFEGAEWLRLADDARLELDGFLRAWHARFVRPLDGALRRLGARLALRGGALPADPVLLEALDAMDRARILAVIRGGPFGVDAMNARLAALSGASRGGFYLGAPVIMQSNDYGRGLYNGDTGLVVMARPEGGGSPSRVVVFRREAELVAHALEPLRGALLLANAITVHKSQGSEYDHVAVVMPPAPHRLLTREILYTGLTRARRSAAVIAARDAVEAAVKTRVMRVGGLLSDD